MKKTAFLVSILFAFFWLNMLHAQISIGGEPVSYKYEKTVILEPVTFDQMPPLDMDVIEAEDAQWEAERAAGIVKKGRRFGIEFDVDYDIQNSGIWTLLPDGGKLWRLGIECPGALSINFIFDRYHLPKGATVYIFAENRSDIIGGFTNYNNQDNNFFATDIVLSDKVIVEYYQPADVAFEAELRIATVVHGYRGLALHPKGFGQSGSCEINTICPIGEGWQDQVKSVFALYEGGWEVCSGAIVNNTANDKKPYALTANHCFYNASGTQLETNPAICVFRFNWESPTCTPTTNFLGHKSMTGSTIRMHTPSNTSNTDCCLLEFYQQIPDDYGVFYAGWSRSTIAPTNAMCIHHPELDIKKITPSLNVTSVTQYVKGWRANWIVGGACTEPGSSGSPLFDQNGRIIGQEYGGLSYCGAPASSMFDVYGRFDQSWNGSAPTNRLKDWLDPLNLDPETWDGGYTFADITDAELLDILVPVNNYYLEETVAPIVKIKNNGTTNITSASVEYVIDENSPVTKEWSGTLVPNATVEIKFDSIPLTYGIYDFKSTVTVADDANPSNNSKSKKFEVIFICEKPVKLKGEVNGKSVLLTWEDSEKIVGELLGYNIYRNEILLNEAPIANKEYFDTLVVGTYCYQISSVYLHCVSDKTDCFTITIEPEFCEPPLNFDGYQLIPVRDFYGVMLMWEEPVNIDGVLLGYNIYRDDKKINEQIITVTNYIDDNEFLPPGWYKYQVSALYEHCEAFTDSLEVFVDDVGINEAHSDSFKIYPNPTTGEFRVTSDKLQVTGVEFFDVYGRKVFSQTEPRIPQTTINISHFQAGIYFVKIYSEINVPVVKRLVIIK